MNFPQDLMCQVFGVRHLSPAAACHLESILKELKPTAVLIEGPSDATEHLKHLVHKDTRPPVAVLAYTTDRPVRSILYPLAGYSPEWVALRWGLKNKADTRFIDLPASVFLELHQIEEAKAEGEELAEEASGPPAEPEVPSTRHKASDHTLAYLDDPYEAIALLSGDPDHETWWERHFEHTIDPDAYIGQIHEFGKGLRSLRQLKENDENLIREAYMRRCITEVLEAGHKPEKVLVVCGAFHSSALRNDLPAMTNAEVKRLPKAKSSLTLMPYSYFRLSAQSGYGAGNHAPAYYQRLFEERVAGTPDRLPAHYLTELCHLLRKEGHMRSAAEVIEAVRLAQSLAAMKDSPAPTLRDLHDAATILFGRGEFDILRPVLPVVDVGTQVGKLPKGISRTSIQEDFYYICESLDLEKYLKDKEELFELDLREDRFVKSRELAWRGLNRSTFFNRLKILEIGFATQQKTRQDQATWKEGWKLRWTPDCEIQLVENALLGDTIEMATAVRLSQRLAESQGINDAASLVKDAANCQLADALENARIRLQAMAIEETGFVPLSGAIRELSEVVRYGTVRKIDAEPLRPLVMQLFLRATLSVRDACICDDLTGREQVKPALVILQDVARETPELADVPRWNHELDLIAVSDNLNPYLSGFVLSMIMSRVSEESLAAEVSRRLSLGVPPDIAAAWFEGLVGYNREALFARMALWRQLDEYLQSLDEQAFRQALVPLRRAFGEFSTGQIRRVVSNLVEISEEGSENLKRSVDVKLSDEEAKKLEEELQGLEELDLGI